MGASDSKLVFGRPPVVVLLCGLQGSGKTTTAAKLALHLRKHEKKTPGLVAADLQRPAAIDQLEQLGRQLQVPVYRTETQDAVVAAREGLERATADGCDVVIVDTAGRLQIDDALMEELVRVRDAVKPLNVLLVLDAMTGQEAVRVARAFQERIAFDGLVLTKLDGDARGGAALSVKAVTGVPVKFASVGEKLDQLDVFHPERMASRILGMGDVLTLIEKAEQAVEEDEQAEMERRLHDRAVHLRRLPGVLAHAQEDGPTAGRDEARPRHGTSARRPGDRRPPDGARRGDRPLDDPARATDTPSDQRPAPAPDRGRQRHDDRGRQPPPPGAQADGEDDEGDGEGQDAGPAAGADRRRRPRSARPTLEDQRTFPAQFAVALTTKGFNGMAVRMRLTRVGSKKNPIYRVVVADSRSPRDGRFIEIVGRYNPQTDPSTIDLDADKVKDWLAKGAQPSEPVARLIKAAGIQ